MGTMGDGDTTPAWATHACIVHERPDEPARLGPTGNGCKASDTGRTWLLLRDAAADL
jgi:hypothetical protein